MEEVTRSPAMAAARLRRLLVPGAIALALVACAGTGAGTGSPSASASERATAGGPSIGGLPSSGGTDAATRPPTGTSAPPALPPRFPVMPGASSGPLPSGPGVVARWTVEMVGSAPYDFYLHALPAAGYPIVGRYPTEHAALIRFEVSAGTIWQLLLEEAGDATLVTVQTDRP